jgi:hypothetical protein
MFASFLVFTWLGFLGCYFCYRAFVTALPNADHYRYAVLIMMWPTLLFWPSSMGKDCWLVFCIGIASLGAARVLARVRGGYTLLVLALAAGSVVRPHVMLMVAIAFVVALMLGRRDERPGVTPSSVAKIAGLVLLIVVGTFLVSRTQSLVGSAGIGDFDTALTQTVSRTQTGSSAFSPPNPRSPIGYPEAVITVLLRPFPFEAHQTEQLLAAVEGLVLAVLIIRAWRRLLTIPRRLRSEPYVTYLVVYVGVFIFVFASIANFGILARERSQVLPFVLALLAIPAAMPKPKPRPERLRQLPLRGRQ